MSYFLHQQCLKKSAQFENVYRINIVTSQLMSIRIFPRSNKDLSMHGLELAQISVLLEIRHRQFTHSLGQLQFSSTPLLNVFLRRRLFASAPVIDQLLKLPLRQMRYCAIHQWGRNLSPAMTMGIVLVLMDLKMRRQRLQELSLR